MIDLTGDLLGYIGAFAAIVLAFIGNSWFKVRKGRKQEREKQKEIDHENAANIRKRVDDVKPMHNDKFKFRD